MKVGIMTIHHAYNFGASLQAYATYKVLKDMGCDVEFIDYDNETFSDERKLFLPITSVGNIFRNARVIMKLKSYMERIKRYEEFYGSSKVSSKSWNEKSDFSSTSYDVIITGSDQTFCLYLTGKPVEMRPFFLESIGDVKRISFSSSMGEKFSFLSHSDTLWIKTCLERFDFLAVRDIRAANYIEKLIGTRPQITLDPTLMLSTEEWDSVACRETIIKGDYIAFYTVLSEPWVIEYVKKLSKIMGIKIVALHARTRYEVNANYEFVNNLGPREFLSVIREAKCVVTTSFHATAFSIIYKKKFASLIVGEGNRLTSLLSMLNLERQSVRNVSDESLSKPWVEDIDYKTPLMLLQKERIGSFNYLVNALELKDDIDENKTN